MKKFAPIAIIAFFGVLSFTACKKDYSCKCTANVAGVSADTTWALGKQKKKDAKAACDAFETTYKAVVTSVGGTLECEVK